MDHSTTYQEILAEMHKALEDFSANSDKLSGYDYEKQFRELTDKYNKRLFQASTGATPRSKNHRTKIKTSFGDIKVKKTLFNSIWNRVQNKSITSRTSL